MIRRTDQPDFDLRVIDRQDGEVVAKFFQKGFLGASESFTQRAGGAGESGKKRGRSGGQFFGIG